MLNCIKKQRKMEFKDKTKVRKQHTNNHKQEDTFSKTNAILLLRFTLDRT